MKKFKFITPLVFLLFCHFIYAQCYNCNDSNNNITNNHNNTFTATNAQAYFWEICNGYENYAEIVGSKTSQTVTVNCKKVGVVKLRLVRFNNGECIESCEVFTCDTIDPLPCPYDSCIKFSAVATDGGYCTDVGITLSCPEANNITSVNWYYSIGSNSINHTGPFQFIGTNGTSIAFSFPHGNWHGKTLHIKAVVTLSNGTVCSAIFGSLRLKCENRLDGGGSNVGFGNFSISKNPSSKSFKIINSSNKKIIAYSITDIKGTQVLNGAHNKNEAINIQTLKNGLYVVKVKYEDESVERKKLIVKN